MKLLIEQKKLADMLNIAARATTKRDIVPGTSWVHMEAANGKLTITTNALETAIKISTADVEIVEEGVVVVSNLIADFVSKLDARPITLEVKDSKLAIMYGKSKGTLNTFDKNDWISPRFEGEGFEEIFAVKSNVFRKALDAVIFAAATENYRPIFTGVLFDLKDGVLNLVASDTHKLAWYAVTDVENPVKKRVVVHTKGLKEFLRVLKDAEDLVTASTNGNTIVFKTENTLVSINLINGQYPDYRAVIPQVEHTIKMNTSDLRATIERFLALPQDNKLQIPVAKLFINGNGELRMEYVSDIAGTVTEIIALEESSSSLETEMAISFNAAYIQEIIKGIGPSTQLVFIDPLRPALVTGENEAAKYVITPLLIRKNPHTGEK